MSISENSCNGHDEIASEFTFIWTISNFSYCTVSKGGLLLSPMIKFQSIGCNNIDKYQTWQLYFYPRGQNDSSVKCVLRKIFYNQDKLDCFLCVCNSKHQLLYKEKSSIQFLDTDVAAEIAVFGREIFERLIDNTLVLHFHAGVEDPIGKEKRVHCFANTYLRVRRTFFNWKVDNFHSIQLQEEKSSGCLAYHTFDMFNSTFYVTVKLFLSGTDLKDATVNAWITFDGLIMRNVYSSCTLLVMDENEKVLKYLTERCWLGVVENTVKFSFKRKEVITEGSSTGSLVLRGEANISGNVNFTVDHVVFGMDTHEAITTVTDLIDFDRFRPPPTETAAAASTLSSDMLSLFKCEASEPDLELLVAGRSFPVHRTVLGARSTVFRSMFDELEASQKSLEIADVPQDTFERVLLYAYTDREPEEGLDWDSLSRLYEAADRYYLSGLKGACRDRLTRALDLDNVPRVLRMADRHSDSDLKERVVEFLIARGMAAVECDSWKKMEQEEPMLANRVLRQIIKRKCM